MDEYFTRDLIHGILFFQVVVLLVLLSNRRIIRRARQHSTPSDLPMVSVLIPARNEQMNIARCIHSLMAQEYPSFEVLVLDDQSSDQTRPILERLSNTYSQLRILDGAPTPKNQLGKNWACSQLANQAQGALFFFTDADTFHQPNTLKEIVTAFLGENADLLTGFPRQEVHTWGERLLVPFFSWALYSLNPLSLSYRIRFPALSGAVGQMMLFRRESYQAIGGHQSLGLTITEDLELAKRIKAAGKSWRMVNASDLISCRMYQGYREAFSGFVKNLFAAFGFRLLPFLFVFTWLFLVFWLPIIVCTFAIFGLAPLAQPPILIVSMFLSVLLWAVPYADLRIPTGLALLYPLTILANVLAAFQSLRYSLSGRLTWKGRSIPSARWRWL